MLYWRPATTAWSLQDIPLVSGPPEDGSICKVNIIQAVHTYLNKTYNKFDTESRTSKIKAHKQANK